MIECLKQDYQVVFCHKRLCWRRSTAGIIFALDLLYCKTKKSWILVILGDLICLEDFRQPFKRRTHFRSRNNWVCNFWSWTIEHKLQLATSTAGITDNWFYETKTQTIACLHSLRSWAIYFAVTRLLLVGKMIIYARLRGLRLTKIIFFRGLIK